MTTVTEKPVAPTMGKFPHKFAGTLADLVDGERYTRFDISSRGLCAYLEGNEFCCNQNKTERGKLCKDHVAALAEQRAHKASTRTQNNHSQKTSKQYPHARWDELNDATLGQHDLLTMEQAFALGYCTFVDQGRFCCAQKLDKGHSGGGGRLCADHTERVRRKQQQRTKERESQQEQREREQRKTQEKREKQTLKWIADSLTLAEGCPDTPEIRMRLARRILANQRN